MTSFLFLILAIVCTISGVVLVQIEISQVNRMLPESEQISRLGSVGSFFRMKRNYKRLYPSGHLDSWRAALQLSALGFILLARIADR